MANDMRNQLIKAGLAPKNDRRGYNQGKQNNGYASRNMNNISGYVAPLNYSPVDDGEKVIKNIKKIK